MAASIDLNADVGEGFGAWTMGADEALLEHVTSANVACGFHAGDPSVIDRTVARAARAGVAIGAHPSHFDLRGFGRREIKAAPAEVEADVLYQVGALAAFARAHGASLAPRQAARRALQPGRRRCRARRGDRARRRARRAASSCSWAWPARTAMRRRRRERAACASRPRPSSTARTTPPDAWSLARGPGAVIHEPAAAADAAVRLARDRVVRTLEGDELAVEADTLCLHGDHPNALGVARAVREALERAGVSVRALAR